jgi:hypothetical protein
MNTESKQKLSALALYGALTYAVGALIVIGTTVASIQNDSPLILSGVIAVVGLALVVGFLGLRFIAESGYRISESCMVIARPFGSLHIAYDCVSRVERVTRSNFRKTEKVRITFLQFGRERVLTLTPECPAIVAEELLTHCSRLTSSRHHRLKRDHTFRTAREMVSFSTSKSPGNQEAPVDATARSPVVSSESIAPTHHL